MNWECPVCGDVWPNAVATLHHVYRTAGKGHGEPESVETEEGPVFPQKTDADPTKETARSGFEEQFSGRIAELIRSAEEDGFETPSALETQDIERFQLLDASHGVLNDIDRLYDEIEYYNQLFTRILENFDKLTGPPTEEIVEQDDESDETEANEDSEPDQPSGRFSTADVREREEREVFKVLERSTFLDDDSDPIMAVFKVVYRGRDGDPLYHEDVADELDIPPGLAQDELDKLAEEYNLIIHNTDDDSYRYPY